MESLNNILKKSLNKEFLSAIISNPREKGGIVKIKIRPVEHKDNILYQCEEHRNNQVFHHNLNEEEAAGYIENAMQEFKQMQMETRKFRYQVLVSKKGKMTIQRRLQTGRFKEIDLSHNRTLYPGGRKSSSIFTGSGSYDKRRGNRADKV